MKRIGVLGTAALLLLLGSSASAYARQEQHEQEAKPENKPEAKPENKPEAKPENKPEAKPAKQEEAKPAKQEAAKPEKQQEGQPAKQEAGKPVKQEQTKAAKQEAPAKTEKQQQAKAEPEQAKSNNREHAQRTPAEEQRQRAVPALRLSVRSSARIPDDRFRANFGHEHVFVINAPVMEGGYVAVSSTAGFGSDLCSPGRWAGITPTTCTLTTLTAGITCTTRIIRTRVFRSAWCSNRSSPPAEGRL